MTKYSDLTSSELLYLADRGHDDAAECLRNRARRGDSEAVHYLTSVMGEDVVPAGAQSANQMLSPDRLISTAVDIATNKVVPSIVSAITRATGPKPAVIRPPIRRPVMVRPPARILPKWGVFVDFMQQPMEIFDTMRAANEWAKTVPQGIPVAVIRSGQEPPRAPLGYVPMLQTQDEMPYVSAYEQAQNISSSTRAPSAYEMYQLAQGQGF